MPVLLLTLVALAFLVGRRLWRASPGAPAISSGPIAEPQRSRSLKYLLSESVEQGAGSKRFRVLRPGFIHPSLARLLFEACPTLDLQEFEAALGRVSPSGRVGPVVDGVLALTFPELVIDFSGQLRCATARVELAAVELPSDLSKADPPMAPDPRTRDPYFAAHGAQNEARGSRCRWELRAFELNPGLPGAKRLEVLCGVVQALAEVLKPEVLFWEPARRFIGTEDFLKAQSKRDLVELVPLVTTVRQAKNAQGTGDFITDSLGLSDFGLPDVQLHVKDLPPMEAALAVFAAAGTVWTRGLFANDGETLQFPSGTVRVVRLRHEIPGMEPKEARIVLDLDPGEPYSAGLREGPAFNGTLQ